MLVWLHHLAAAKLRIKQEAARINGPARLILPPEQRGDFPLRRKAFGVVVYAVVPSISQ